MEPCYSQAQLCSTFPTPREQHVLSWAVLRIQGGRMASLHSLKHLFVVGVGFFFLLFRSILSSSSGLFLCVVHRVRYKVNKS